MTEPTLLLLLLWDPALNEIRPA